jgi:glycosyltransferase involved in cell wall biosynthesis
MKLIIQIPCFNEAETLPAVFENMPKHIPGVDTIEYQIIDDGCTDNTVEVAKALGVHHIVTVRAKNRRWLGRAFRMGVDNALKNGADILVNTDGDNQYPSSLIKELVTPLVFDKYDICIGDRSPGSFKEFSPIKRMFQRLGSNTIQWITGVETRDAVSGFRAYTKEALLRINIITNYTYTVDTLMQAHKKGFDIAWIPVPPNAKTRESRLISSIPKKIFQSGFTILRFAVVYEPFKTLCLLSSLLFIPSIILFARFFYFYFFIPPESAGHIQSLVVAGACLVVAALLFVFGIIGDLLSVNRMFVEDLLTRIRRLEVSKDAAMNKETLELVKKVVGGN